MILKAIDRIKWRVKNGWKANENDQDAINTIIQFVNFKHTEQLKQNHLFFKLYVVAFAWYIDKYKATIFDPLPQKELHKLLDQPIDRIVKRLTDKINLSELEGVLKEKGIDPLEVVSNAGKGNENDVSGLKMEDFNDKHDLETVKYVLEQQFNLMLNENY